MLVASTLVKSTDSQAEQLTINPAWFNPPSGTFDRALNRWTFTAPVTIPLTVAPNRRYAISGTNTGNTSIEIRYNNTTISDGVVIDDWSRVFDVGSDNANWTLHIGVGSVTNLRVVAGGVFNGDPIPPDSTTSEARLLVTPSIAGDAYNPASQDLFDNNEDTGVRQYTYAAGQTAASFDGGITFTAIELAITGTSGYSGEVGYFGGPFQITLDGMVILSGVVAASPELQRFRATNLAGWTGTNLALVKPSNSRFWGREIYLYTQSND